MDLQTTINDIAAKFPFDAEHYPDLAGKSPEEILRFAIRHNTLHMGKALGKFSTFCEDEDHGETGDRALLEQATVKMLINILRAAELQGLDADTLLALVPKYMK